MLWWTLWRAKRKLLSDSPYMRELAADSLADIGNAKAVDLLIAGLQYKYEYAYRDPEGDRSSKRRIISALGKIGDARAVEPIIRVLSSHRNDSDVLRSGAIALGQMPDARAVKPLLEMLSNTNENVVRAAIEALVRIGDLTVEGLIKELKASYGRQRPGAAEALGKIGDRRAVKPLIEALKDHDPKLRQAATEALKALKYEPEDKQQRAKLLVAAQEWDEAAKLGAAAIEPLVDALQGSDENLRKAIAEALVKIRGDRVIKSLTPSLSDRRHYKWALATLDRVSPDWREAVDSNLIAEHLVAVLDKIDQQAKTLDQCEGVGDEMRGIAAELLRLGDTPIAPLAALLKRHITRTWDKSLSIGAAMLESKKARLCPEALEVVIQTLLELGHVESFEDALLHEPEIAVKVQEKTGYTPTTLEQRVLLSLTKKPWERSLWDVVSEGKSAIPILEAASKEEKFYQALDAILAVVEANLEWAKSEEGRKVLLPICISPKGIRSRAILRHIANESDVPLILTSYEKKEGLWEDEIDYLREIGGEEAVAGAIRLCIKALKSNIHYTTSDVRHFRDLLRREDIRSHMSNDALLETARLERVQLKRSGTICAEHWPSSKMEDGLRVDFEHGSAFGQYNDVHELKQLARQELIRRGIKA
ncbi:MAG TPA: HEAT repeat domain-containing protein [Pyrinomonadaceae bacterium]|jgi:HEAT repeat protein